MAHQFSPNVEQLIREKMASGRYSSEEELLLDALQSLEANEVELRAIQEGIDSVERGHEGVALDEAFQKLRDKHHIQDPS
jgi:Arc/MetJ-type ribon-helix-helix transcriptional regulator